MDYGLNISHDDTGGQNGLAGGLGQLGIAGAASLAEKFFGTGTPSPAAAARARYDAELAQIKARARQREYENGWSLPKKQANNAPFALQALKKKTSEGVFRQSSPGWLLKENIHRSLCSHLKAVCEREPSLAVVAEEHPFESRDFVWHGPNGPDHDARHAVSELNLGHGGRYNFVRVHDTRRPEEWREAYAQYFEGVARLYAMNQGDAAIMALEEAYLPFGGGGLARLGVDSGQVLDALGGDNAEGLVLSTANYSVLNVVKSASEALRARDVGVFKSPDSAEQAALQEVQRCQFESLQALTRKLYRDTQENTGAMALRLARRAGTKLSQANDDTRFANQQNAAIQRACDRESQRQFEACRLSVAEEQGELNADTILGAGVASGLAKGAAAGPIAIGVQWAHKTVRLRRKSPACREAFKDYAQNVCINRVLPNGSARVSATTDMKVSPQ